MPKPIYVTSVEATGYGTFVVVRDCCVDGHLKVSLTYQSPTVTGCPPPGGGGGDDGRDSHAHHAPVSALPTWVMPGQWVGPRLAVDLELDPEMLASPPPAVFAVGEKSEGSSFAPVGLYAPERTAMHDVAFRIPPAGSRPALFFSPILAGPFDFRGAGPLWVPCLEGQRQSPTIQLRQSDSSISTIQPTRLIEVAGYDEADFSRPGIRVVSLRIPDPASPDRMRSVPFLLGLRPWSETA